MSRALLLLAAFAVASASALRCGQLRPVVPATRASPLRAQLPPADDESAAPEPALLPVVVGLLAFASVEPASAAGAWIAPTKAVLTPTFALFTILFLFRVVLSWFPKYDLNVLPWNIAAWPTEPILKPTRRFIPPVAGVDISPLVWVAILSFLSEVLTGPQGLLAILQKSS